ncbi:MAG: TetR/AcrR family transcriptional regulator [Proteobacteria bacterium]|nr:TetR/AcrR family transcriptional regulator [Pseudomonadota bacterium]
MTRKRAAAPAKPARRTQQERRRATQEAILEAAIDLLVDEGYSRFSTIAVAKRAKVSRGARENYFPSKYDLIAAAWRAALIRAQEHARELARDLEGGSTIDRFLSDSESFFLSRVYLALLELQMAARTDKPLSRIFHALYDEYRESHDDIWIEALVKEGYARVRAKAFVRATQYLLRGMALTSVWHVPHADFRAALREWRELAPYFLARTMDRRGA